jgi:hypothetical protein
MGATLSMAGTLCYCRFSCKKITATKDINTSPSHAVRMKYLKARPVVVLGGHVHVLPLAAGNAPEYCLNRCSAMSFVHLRQ